MEHTWIDYQLPSQGRWYGDKLPDGKVAIRQLTTREAALLDSDMLSALDRTNRIIDNCVKLPNTIKPSELLTSDRFALLLNQRIATFGPHYSFKLPAGGRLIPHTVNLIRDLTETTPDRALDACREAYDEASEEVRDGLFKWDGSEPFRITLPDSGDVLTLRFLRGADESQIMTTAARGKGQPGGGDDAKIVRLTTHCVSVEDKPELDDAYKRSRYIRDMSFRDSLAIERALEARETGIDTSISIDLPGRGLTTITLPMDAEFFRPSRL